MDFLETNNSHFIDFVFFSTYYGKDFYYIAKVERIMPVMDEFKEEREALKNQPFKKKFQYFWTYYKWHTIGTIVGAILLFVLVKDIVTHKDYGFYGILVNTYPIQEEMDAFENEAAIAMGIDTDKYQVAFDSSYYLSEDIMESNSYQTAQMLMVHTASGDVDIMIMDTANFNKYGYNSYYADLRLYLSEEQLKALEGRIFYADATLAARIEEESYDKSWENAEPEYPTNPLDPESMDNPIPIGIALKGCEKFESNYLFSDGMEGYFGIFPGTKHPEEVVKFVDFLFELN